MVDENQNELNNEEGYNIPLKDREVYTQASDPPMKDLWIKRKAKLVVPKIKGKRKVCIKAVDVFGFESAVVVEVR